IPSKNCDAFHRVADESCGCVGATTRALQVVAVSQALAEFLRDAQSILSAAAYPVPESGRVRRFAEIPCRITPINRVPARERVEARAIRVSRGVRRQPHAGLGVVPAV